MSTISHQLSLVVLILAAAILFSAADEIYENRGIKSGNGEKRPFFVGSRYGRSSPSDLSNADSKARIVTRNDRFFIGSRYGKRSTSNGIDEESSSSLECHYTGYLDLYRCVAIPSNFEGSSYESN